MPFVTPYSNPTHACYDLPGAQLSSSSSHYPALWRSEQKSAQKRRRAKTQKRFPQLPSRPLSEIDRTVKSMLSNMSAFWVFFMPQCKSCKLFIKIKKKMNSCISHNLLGTVSRSQTQAVFKKVTANPCKGKCCLFRKAWSQVLIKGNPKPAPLCFSEGGQDARSGISLLFSACQLQCAQCLQQRYQH